MKTTLGIILAGLVCVGLAQAKDKDEGNGLIIKQSPYSVSVGLGRLALVLRDKGIPVIGRIDFTAGARANYIPLRPNQMLLFGDPKLYSHLLTAQPTTGLDLPLEVQAWEDEEGKVWLAYTDPAYVIRRHEVKKRDDVAEQIRALLDEVTDAVIAP